MAGLLLTGALVISMLAAPDVANHHATWTEQGVARWLGALQLER
jgi:hypothetical protein